ncbi:alpha,alpha-trehalose-phosphate synthase (UDP-forming) [Roseinatronobacter alkalisoli]|uniref:Trehalose-6-phosphate synthase n=1 Tax=Roseinatronobacter alkalisoli TaxID=3028235 RepID=A0ABT5TB44_9RHOB|nr:trehalose-6-phosphate synthase [Roseinatronobacter sp. HJB301]MDD7972338.1 trehalose-6-phosphate synthase [Roseinatronobacter sp. HJB301]
MSTQDDTSDHDPFPAAMIDRIRTFLRPGWAETAVSQTNTGVKEAPSRKFDTPAPKMITHARNPDDWDVTRLRTLIRNELAGTDVILVSNREPYVHTTQTDGIRCEIPAGGLVSALEPIARGCGGTWIAHGSGSADRETVDAHDRIQVPPGNPGYTLRRVWITPEEEKGYYVGFANESLWPLCHNAFVRPVFRAADWCHYRAVNARFADAVKQEARTDSPIVIVQDYHFALLPRMIRERLPNATIVSFWHIPWPNAEVFGICPHAAEVLDGMLGSDIIGFQVPLFRINFIDCVERTLESRINPEDCSVRYGSKLSRVRTYPISIAWPPDPTGQEMPATLSARKAMGAKSGAKLILAVGRLDYTKGIPEFLSAFEELLVLHPEWRGNIHLFYVAAPSRGEVASYRSLHKQCLRLSEAINDRFGTPDYTPLLFMDRHVDRDDLRHLYREADICVVPSLHDGMNLVAKEFVAERRDEQGVLILSRFAGATQEMPEALAVNPFDISKLAATLKSALEMPPDEQAARMRRMRETVRSKNIYRWAGRLLEDAVHFRRRNQLLKRGGPVQDRLRRVTFRAQPEPAILTSERNDAETPST